MDLDSSAAVAARTAKLGGDVRLDGPYRKDALVFAPNFGGRGGGGSKDFKNPLKSPRSHGKFADLAAPKRVAVGAFENGRRTSANFGGVWGLGGFFCEVSNTFFSIFPK